MTPDPTAATDKRVLETLKAVHNRGAELYNAGDHAAALRLYQGALLVARAFLDHRPAVRQVIDDGLHEVEASESPVRLKAFRLHEVIEQTRADLKAVWQAAKAAAAGNGRLTGVVAAGGRPLPHVTVILAGPGGQTVATTATAADGSFTLPAPPGEYGVIVTGPGVPTDPSPPQPVEVRPDGTTVRIDLT